MKRNVVKNQAESCWTNMNKLLQNKVFKIIFVIHGRFEENFGVKTIKDYYCHQICVHEVHDEGDVGLVAKYITKFDYIRMVNF